MILGLFFQSKLLMAFIGDSKVIARANCALDLTQCEGVRSHTMIQILWESPPGVLELGFSPACLCIHSRSWNGDSGHSKGGR